METVPRGRDVINGTTEYVLSWYKLWADGEERHIRQEWQRIVVGLQKVLQVVQAKPQAALSDSAVTDSALTV